MKDRNYAIWYYVQIGWETASNYININFKDGLNHV